jgi:hypothetical protein
VPGPARRDARVRDGEITKFDMTGITGTFGFEVETHDKTQRAAVQGSFDFGCVGQKCK